MTVGRWNLNQSEVRAAAYFADEYGSNDQFRERNTFVHEMPGDDENVSLGNGMVTSRWNVRYDEHQELLQSLFPEWLKADGEINTTAEDRARAAARRAASEAG